MEQEEFIGIEDWCNKIIKGPTGFLVCEDREIMIHPKGREMSVAEWVIRCLANPDCKGSEDVLDAILTQRVVKKATS